MTAKEYLRQLKQIDNKIDQKILQQQDLRNKAKIIGSIDYSRDRVQSSFQNAAPYTALVEQIADLDKEICCTISAFLSLKNEIINKIQSIPNDNYSSLLFKHYVEYKPLKLAAAEMNYSYRYTLNLHNCALLEFEKVVT